MKKNDEQAERILKECQERDNENALRQTKQIVIMVMFAIFMICGTLLIYNIFFGREYVDIDCSMTGIDYKTEQYTDVTFNTQTFNLQNSTIICKGKMNVQNIVLMIMG